MLSLEEATKKLLKVFPNGKIKASIEYRDLFVFQMFVFRPLETEWDPFYSVNKITGELRDFSVIEDGNIGEINALFMKAKGSSKEVT